MRPRTMMSRRLSSVLLTFSLLANVYLVLQFNVDRTVRDSNSELSFQIRSVSIGSAGEDEFCNETSPWHRVIIPERQTSLLNWSFKSTVKCPQLNIDKYPKSRTKIVLNCNGDKGRLLSTVTNSTRDVAVMEFGNKCLASVIDKCCTGNQKVPNVIHYIWYKDDDLNFFHFLSLMSVLRFVKPCLILIHGPFIPKGPYWDYFISISPNVIHMKRDRPTIIFGHTLAFREHSSDIMRIEALTHYGGIYLDFDEVVLRPLEPLRKHDYVQGHELPKTMGSQLVMARRNAPFLKLWYDGYRTDYRKTWAWNALWVPNNISKVHPELIHVEGFNFTRPNWMNAKKQIFQENYDWSTNYGMHLYLRYFNGTVDPSSVRRLNTTLGAVSRHILFGNKELCST